MRLPTKTSKRIAMAAAAVAVVGATGAGVAAATAPAPPSNGTTKGHGIPEYGMTHSYYKGTGVGLDYTKGFYCDTSVSAASSTGCEAGANFAHPPAKNFDPLYITVPLGFSQPMDMIQCPPALACVAHPGTIDLSRLEPALKPLYPQLTDAQLTAALKNFATPEHDHFIDNLNNWQPEWWDVKVVGVTDQATFKDIRDHRSASYIEQLQKNGNKNVTPTIPTNLFLYFGAKG